MLSLELRVLSEAVEIARAKWNIFLFLGIGFEEVSSKVWDVDLVGKDK